MNTTYLAITFLLFFTLTVSAADQLPRHVSGCASAVKTVLAKYEGANVPVERDSEFLTSEFLKPVERNGSEIKAPDGSFILNLIEVVPGVTNKEPDCGDTQRYNVIFRDNKGKKRPINDPASCGDNLIEISPNSQFILLSGLHYVDIKKWETCPLLPKDTLGYPMVLGWSRDGKKVLIRDYSNWEGASSAEEAIIEINDK